MGCTVAYILFQSIHNLILTSHKPVVAAQKYLPYYVGFTLGVCFAFLLINGPKFLRVSQGFALGVFLVISCVVSLILKLQLIPKIYIYGNLKATAATCKIDIDKKQYLFLNHSELIE